MKKGCIYYTDSQLDPEIMRVCQEQLKKAFDGEIVSVSLKPMDFGENIVLGGYTRSYPTMLTQILLALKASTADIVFFTEHDVLYHPSHFKINPTRKSVYYYNINNYRWRFPTDVAITYDELTSLSGMCCYRETALKHYEIRLKAVEAMGEAAQRGREPRWARRWGYEPGTKRVARGGFTDEGHARWKSEYPNVDLRHKGTFTHPKTFKEDFKHIPETFRETAIDKIPGWDLKKLFNL